MAKKIFRNSLIVILVLLVFSGAFIFALRYPAVQTFFAHRATDILSKTLNTKVSIERVQISFFNKAELVNFYLEDHNRDTVIYSKALRISFSVFDLFDKKVNVKKIFLDNAVVHIHRDKEGKTNITEIFKALGSKKAEPDTTKKSFDWMIDLEELEVSKTDFHYLDDKGHTDVKVLVGTLAIDLNKVSLKDKLIDIANANLSDVDVQIGLLKRPAAPSDDSIMHVQFMVGGMTVKFDEFAIANTRVRVNDFNSDSILPKGMDFKHLDISAINLTAEDGTIVGDSVVGKITHLSAKERSGFVLTDLTTQARVSVNDINLEKLNLKTPNSELKNYLSFRFNAYHDFKDFLNAVRIKADFDNTKFSLKDLGYFLRNLDKLEHNRLTINGEIDGRINNLKGRGIEIRAGNNSVFQGDFYTRGLPSIYETSLNLRVKRLATTIDDARKFYPQIKFPANLNNLGLIYYTGSLDGFITDFVSNGKLVTSLGTANTDVNFKYDKKKNKAFYKGNLALNEFNLGKFFNDEINLGKVSLQGKIDGGGLTLESLHANLEGTVSSLQLKGYDYRDIQVNGYIVRKSFNGLFQIHDDNLDMDFNGRADLSKSTPDFRFETDIRWAKLKNLNLMKDDLRITGKMKSDFSGAKVDDMDGKVELKDVVLLRDTVLARIKYLDLSAKLADGGKREIKLNSDFAEAEMTGNFSFTELPKALLDFTKYTFTKDYTDTTVHAQQDFTADIRIYEPGNLTRILYPQFQLIRNSHIQGSFNSNDHHVKLEATIPQLKFAGYDARRIEVNSDFDKGEIDFKTVVDKVYGGDSVIMDTVAILTKTTGNKDVRFDIMVADKKRFNYANVTAFLTPLKGKAFIRLEPSDVKLANYNWHFLPDNSILVEGKKITTKNLVFKTYDQTIYIASYLKHDTSTCFKLTLDNTDISDFTGIFTQKMKDMSGAMNGKLVVEDVFYKPKVFANLVVNEFTLGKELIGDIDVESTLDEAGKNILLYASIKSINNFVETRGSVSLDATKPGMNIDIDAKRLGINFLNYKFFERYVKNCRGYAVAKVNMHGTFKKPLLTGDVLLVDDTVTVSFLNTTYHLKNQKAKLDEHGFDLCDLTIYDVQENVLYATGRINHESFRQFALDLKVNTPGAQFINTTAKQSPGFYGVAYGSGNVTFYGNINSPVIKAYAKTLPGTWCNLPISSSFEVNRYGFYKFNNGKEEKKVVQAPQLKLNGVNFILELEATDDARMDIILDPVNGDILTTYGHGPLKIEIPKVGSTTMFGDYEINRGSYLFTLQSVINKRFELNKGGVIHFTGDIYKAALNVDAAYQVRASPVDLFNSQEVSGSGQIFSNILRSRIPVSLLMNLTGVLERPNINFTIRALDADPTIKSQVDQKLSLLKTNDAELNKQVFGLLVMNRFLPSGTTGDVLGKGNYAGATAANTVSEFLSSQLSNYLGNLFDYSGNSALQNLDINIGYRQYDQQDVTQVTGTNALDTRRELQLALQQRLLNNRLTINAGTNLDFGNSTQVDNNGTPVSGSRSVIPTGDFQIQYALTPDGRWSAKAFNRTNYDYYNSRNTNRTGIGISYRKEFDKASELFTAPKKKPKKVKAKEEKQKEQGKK